MKDFVDYQKKSDDTVSRLSEEIAKARTDLEMAYLKKVTGLFQKFFSEVLFISHHQFRL